MRACLPDGGHGEVQLHEESAVGQQAGSQEEHPGVGGPVGRGDVAGDLVGARWVGLDVLLGCQHPACTPMTGSFSASHHATRAAYGTAMTAAVPAAAVPVKPRKAPEKHQALPFPPQLCASFGRVIGDQGGGGARANMQKGPLQIRQRHPPEKHRGMEIRNHSAIREKKAPRGMEPEEPVWWMSTFRTVRMAREMPVK